jgi:hypothetical protein
MGRLLAALIAESEIPTSATPATLLLREPESSRVAKVATVPASQTERLLAALRAEGLPDAFVGFDHGDEAFLTELDASGLLAYVRVLRDAELRERGQRPDDETAPAFCTRCGPIWLHPSVAAVAPMVDGWARVLGCAWCHVTDQCAIPRPPVTCRTCQHFQCDVVNPAGGIGRCTVARVRLPSEPLSYPFAERRCGEWRASRPEKPE